MMYILLICRVQDCWFKASNVFSFVKCKVFIGVITDKNVNRCPVLNLVNAINDVNVCISSFGSAVICKEVCHLCGDEWSTDLDWNHTIVSGWYLESWFQCTYHGCVIVGMCKSQEFTIPLYITVFVLVPSIR